MSMTLRAMKMEHVTDPKKDLLGKVGDIEGWDLFHSDILIAIYQRPKKTAGGILLTDDTVHEEVFQGKVGLVLKKGPAAFKDDSKVQFYGKDVQIGDWVVFHPSDGRLLAINDAPCRIMQDVHIRGTIPEPDAIW